jgi:hypothetical protein
LDTATLKPFDQYFYPIENLLKLEHHTSSFPIVSEGLAQMKIPAFQHFIIAVLLSFFVAVIPLVLLLWNSNWGWNWKAFSSDPESRTGYILWFVAFGLTGFFWMLFEGKTPPYRFEDWFVKIIIRGLFIWGIILGLLIWYLPMIFNIRIAEGFDLAIPFVFTLSSIMGLILSFILSIYSYLFIKG